jgi:DNA-binding response OmpR family regulator
VEPVSCLFHRAGYEAVAVELGEVVLEMCAVRSFDVAVVDIQMPGMNGLELLARLRQAGVTIPVLFISGAAHFDQLIPHLALGYAKLLKKPFRMDDFLEALRTAMGAKPGN